MAKTNLIGKNILGYTVCEEQGSGAFGTVYKVVKTNASGQYVRALKHITIPTEKQYHSVLNSMGGDASKADDYFAKMLESIVSEIRILSDLSEQDSRHIVRYYENDIITTETPKRYEVFILMEYLTPIEDYIKQADFRVRDAVKLGLDILAGLKLCHDNKIIHRDIKDDNIFASGSGEYKIGDFGVSKVLKDSAKAESLKGTPNFLAPEVYSGKEGYTKSVDLYALGIVLYRLLNYNRNPFLPRFPQQYYSQDEDRAFDERMQGKQPGLPDLGGEAIGRVILKAISKSAERFQTADEFIDALKAAVDRTSDDELNTSIGFETRAPSVGQNGMEQGWDQNQYAATLGEMAPQPTYAENTNDDDQNESINKHVFDTLHEGVPQEAPKVDPVVRSDNKEKGKNVPPTPKRQPVETVTSTVPQYNVKPEEPVAIDKKTVKKIVYLIPAALLLIGIVAFFIVVPSIYGKVVSFVEWIFTDPQNIIDTLRDSGAVLPEVYSIIGIRIFWWVWLAGFAASLFFVGKQLQAKPEVKSVNAVLKNKEPYLMIQDVNDALKQASSRTDSKQMDSLLYAVKKLKERLSVESDFGYGSDAVIDCENNIAKQLSFLAENVGKVENGDTEANIKALNAAVMNINSLLQRRIELKKR